MGTRMLVKKRDDRIDPFDQAKIVTSINKAANSTGTQEELLAEELASVVTLFLEKEYLVNPIPAQSIQEMVEKVLMETGHTEIARAYILFKERRDQIKCFIQVRDSDSERKTPTEIEVDATDQSTLSEWSKGKIVSALMKEAELPVEMAGEIANKVEERVFKSGMTRISSSLIRELVDNELFIRGFNRRLLGQSIIGVPGYDLRKLVESSDAGKTPLEVDKRVAGTVLRQYSLREIFNPEESEAHIRGDFLIEGLERPSGYVDVLFEPTLLQGVLNGAQGGPEYIGTAIKFLERFVSRSVIADVTNAAVYAYVEQGTAPFEFFIHLFKNLALGPASVQDLVKSPKLRVSRNLNEERAKLLGVKNMAHKASLHFMDNLVNDFLDAATQLGKDLALPYLHLDLAGRGQVEEKLLSKLVILEAADRLRVSASYDAWRPIAPITPLIGQITITMNQALKNLSTRQEEHFFKEFMSQAAMASASIYSKNQYINGLHRRGKGPKHLIQRYLKQDMEVLGPGFFTLFPSAIFTYFYNNDKTSTQSGRPNKTPVKRIKQIQNFITEEGKKSGCLIKLKAPWDHLIMGEKNPSSCAQTALMWSQYMDLDPMPGCFKGEALERMRFIRLVLEGLLERDHVS